MNNVMDQQRHHGRGPNWMQRGLVERVLILLLALLVTPLGTWALVNHWGWALLGLTALYLIGISVAVSGTTSDSSSNTSWLLPLILLSPVWIPVVWLAWAMDAWLVLAVVGTGGWVIGRLFTLGSGKSGGYYGR